MRSVSAIMDDVAETRSRQDPGANLATMQDVAALAGVSVSTVSRALRSVGKISPATSARVLAAAQDLDFRPNPNASRLRRGLSQAVAVAVPALNHWYVAEIVAGINAVLEARGYDTILSAVADETVLRRLLDDANPKTRQVDGVIVVDLAIPPNLGERIWSEGTTIVTTGRALPYFSSVMVDDIEIGHRATRFLLSLGHERVGLIGGDPASPYQFNVSANRRAGFLHALHEAGLPGPAVEVNGNFALLGGRDAVDELVSQSGLAPTALVCMSDEMALGAMSRLEEMQLDMSLIGVDDHELAAPFGLTTIRQPVREIGRRAADLMLDALSDTPELRHEVLPTELVIRESTCAL